MSDPFNELRRHASSNHPQKVKMNVILGAITEVVYEQRNSNVPTSVPISPTEYFAALMTALSSGDKTHIHELLLLLGIVLPHVPEAVLRAKFQMICQCLGRIGQGVGVEDAILRPVVQCIGILLKSQEPSPDVWSRPVVLKAFHMILNLSIDSRPKIRKLALVAVTSVLQVHKEYSCDALSTQIATFAETILNSKSANESTKVLPLLACLKEVMPYLHTSVITSLSSAILPIIATKQKMPVLVTLQVLQKLLLDSTTPLQRSCLEEILSKILEYDLETHDPSTSMHLILILSRTLVRMQSFDATSAEAFVPGVVLSLCSFFQTTNQSIHQATSKALSMVVVGCITEEQLTREISRQEIGVSKQPSTLKRVICSLESLLALRYQQAWSCIFQCLSKIFTHFGDYGSPLLDSIIRSIGELYEAISSMPSSGEDTERMFTEAVGTAIASMGPEKVLALIPLRKSNTEVSALAIREWLIPALRDNIKSHVCSFSYFTDEILQLAKFCETESRKESTTPLQAKQLRTRTVQLWSTFPSFCVQPNDIKDNFKRIAKTLVNALLDERYPELQVIICQGLQLLPRACKVDETNPESDKKIEDRKVLSKYSAKYLPVLMRLVEEADAENDSERLQTLIITIQELASMADSQFISGIFKQLLQKLLESSTEAQSAATNADGKKAKAKSHRLMSIGLALVSSIDDQSICLLYRVVKPNILNDADPIMQKRSYTVLVSICAQHPQFILEEKNLRDLIDSLCDSLLTCSIPAKKMRLRCLYHVITAMKTTGKAQMELIPPLVGEIMLCTKEANAKAREAAFELLIAMAKLVSSVKENGLMEFFQMVLGGLAAQTPHMRSAAVLSISRLVYEFGHENASVSEAMPNLLQTIVLLLHEKAREVIKSVIGFMKLAIAIIPNETLKQYLPDIIEGLLQWVGDSKNRFRAKTRIIMMKLCRKFGYETIEQLVPEEDRSLIRHIRKTKEREDRKKQEEKNQRHEEKTKRASFEKFMEDSDDEDFHDNTNKRKNGNAINKQNRSWIKESEDDVVDFLDQSVVRNVVKTNPEDMDDDESDTEYQVSKDGRLIVPSMESNDNTDDDFDMDDNEDSVKRDVEKKLKEMGLGGSKVEKNSNPKRKRDNADGGGEYKSKKAGGDMKKKGKFEPYAYIPLNPKHMSKRNKRNAVESYGRVGKQKRNGRKN